jgi:hypothetical protein
LPALPMFLILPLLDHNSCIRPLDSTFARLRPSSGAP